jgi:tetratricopeptide (TPR) repeat protein
MTALVSLLAIVAHAQEDVPVTDLSVEADVHFRRGIQAFKDGDYQSALEHLMLSNRLVPNRNVMKNIAVTWEKLGDYQQAYRYYADYVALEPDPQKRATAEAAITAIMGKVALVRVESDPPGATVYIDRKNLGARGATPRTLALPPGEHVILVEKEGHLPVETHVTAAMGEFNTADVTLERILGKLHVDGTSGASIRVDDEQAAVIGTVPADLSLPPGPHVLVVSMPGRETQRIVAEVSASCSPVASW